MRSNQNQMQIGAGILAVALMPLFLTLCGCQTDVTKHPAQWTDFVVGRVYELKQPAWLSHGSLMTLRGKEPLDSEGLMSSGAKLKVRQVVVFRSPEVGTHTEVFAEVLSGEQMGRTFSVSVVSERIKNGYTKRNPQILETVE